MSLDAGSLDLVAVPMATMLGAMLLLWGRQEHSPALYCWGSGYLLGATSVTVWTVAGARIGQMPSVALGALAFLACGMVWNASRIFHSRCFSSFGLLFGAIAWIAAAMILGGEASALRVTLGAGIVAGYAALTAGEIGSAHRDRPRQRWQAVTAAALPGLLLMLPILLGNWFRPRGDRLLGDVWVTIFSIEILLYAVGIVFVVFLLLSERALAMHKQAASIDPLTGILNRRGFVEQSLRAIEREAGHGGPVSLLMFDLDHFKRINDRFGHPAGDEILKLFAVVLANGLRTNDLAGRMGGEEFAALVPGSVEQGLIAAERVREAFANSGIAIEDGPVDTSVSVGVAAGPAGTELDVLLAAADAALYRAKRGGRNRVETAAGLALPREVRRLHSARRPSVPASPRNPQHQTEGVD
jgi:diguanylate cyclase (GGDEF)-like protein